MLEIKHSNAISESPYAKGSLVSGYSFSSCRFVSGFIRYWIINNTHKSASIDLGFGETALLGGKEINRTLMDWQAKWQTEEYNETTER